MRPSRSIAYPKNAFMQPIKRDAYSIVGYHSSFTLLSKLLQHKDIPNNPGFVLIYFTMNFSTAQQLFLGVFLLCQVAPGEFGKLDEILLHHGDFMEFQAGLDTACANVTGGDNATEEIRTTFSQCISNVTTEDRSLFVVYANICSHPAEYLQCWDMMKMETLSKCGKNNSDMLPAIYKTTLTSFCGDDKGVKNIAAMKKASEETGTQTCEQPNPGHWTDFCKTLMPNFTTKDLCARHTAINQCVEKNTCDNIALGKLIRKNYADLRPLLKCKN